MIIENVKTNIVPSLTWNWLKSNCDEVTVNTTFVQADAKYTSLPKGITAEKVNYEAT